MNFKKHMIFIANCLIFISLKSHAAVYQCDNYVITSNIEGQKNCVEVNTVDDKADINIEEQENHVESKADIDDENYYGLGATQRQWENKYGRPFQCSSLSCSYGDPAKIIMFENGNIRLIQFTWPTKRPITQARRTVETTFIPKDSKYQKTYTSNSGAIVDAFQSNWIKNRFDAESPAWRGSKPGEFVVIYEPWGVIMGIGNNDQ